MTGIERGQAVVRSGRAIPHRSTAIGIRRAALATLLLLAVTASLHAHLALRGSSPGAGEVLTQAPTAIELSFTEPVELPLSRFDLRGPEGPVVLGEIGASDGAQVLSLPVEGRLVAGSYTVTWQAVGRDGHPVRGEFSFQVDEGAEGLAAEEEVAPAPPPPLAVDPPPTLPTFDARSPLYAGVRWLTYLGILGTVGAAGFALLVLRRIPRGSWDRSDEFVRDGLRASAGLGVLASLFLIVSLPLRLQAQSPAPNTACD